MTEKKNKITFIIATKNDYLNLIKTLKSIEKVFKGINYELIIKDANSIIKPDKIVKKFKNITHYVSKNDKGIYDAWNYSMKYVKTEYVSFLGAGDKINLNYKNFLNFCVLKKKTNFFYCKANLIGTKVIIGKNTNKKLWPFIMPIVHVGGIFKSNFLKKNNYKPKFKISGDYEVLLRTRKFIKINFYDKVCLGMKPGGISQDPKKIFLRLSEMFISIRENYNIVTASLYFTLNIFVNLFKK
jgi:hypothetical protein